MIARRYAPEKPGIDKEFDDTFNENFGNALDDFMTVVRELVPATVSDDKLEDAAFDLVWDLAYFRTLSELDMAAADDEEEENKESEDPPPNETGLNSLPPIT